MPLKLLSTDEFRSAAKNGRRPEGTVFRLSTTEPQVRDEAARKVRFVFSDGTVDHAGDSIDPNGWDLGVFRRNPVALFSHMSWEPPIGRASNVVVQGGKLVGDIEFASAEVYPFADTVYRLVKGGFLKAVSVGFKPDKWAFSGDRDRPAGIDFKKQTLLEISVCPVPCNPNALNEARSAGIDTRPLTRWAERILDSRDRRIPMPRRELEAIRAQSSPSERLREVAELKQSFAVERRAGTPAERLREVAELRRSWGGEQRAETPAERRIEAADIKRKLRAQGID